MPAYDPFSASQTQSLSLLIPAEGRFRQPIVVEAESTRFGKWRIHKRGLALYGFGETPQAALEDFKDTLLQYYYELERTFPYLNSSLLCQLYELRRLIFV